MCWASTRKEEGLETRHKASQTAGSATGGLVLPISLRKPHLLHLILHPKSCFQHPLNTYSRPGVVLMQKHLHRRTACLPEDFPSIQYGTSSLQQQIGIIPPPYTHLLSFVFIYLKQYILSIHHMSGAQYVMTGSPENKNPPWGGEDKCINHGVKLRKSVPW